LQIGRYTNEAKERETEREKGRGRERERKRERETEKALPTTKAIFLLNQQL
jgi:hypothetical protein